MGRKRTPMHVSRRPVKSQGKSAGFWRGDFCEQVKIRVVLRGIKPLLINPIPGFGRNKPSLTEPYLAMCFRAAAWYVKSLLKRYLPQKNATDFLPFMSVCSCALSCRSWKNVTIPTPTIDKNGQPSAGKHIHAQVLKKWSITAEVVVAYFPGVTEEGIIELIQTAGCRIGLGLFRPQHHDGRSDEKGTFELAQMVVVSGKWPTVLDAPEISASRSNASWRLHPSRSEEILIQRHRALVASGS